VLSIVYDDKFDILYVDFKTAYADSEWISNGVYVRKDMKTDEIVGFHIEDFSNKVNADILKLINFIKTN